MKKPLAIAAASLATAAVLGLAVVLAGILNREIAHRMDEARDRTIAGLEQFIGRKVRYGSISPSFLRAIEIRDLAILGEGENGPPLVTIHRLRLYYSLARLIATRDPVASLTEARIVSSRFSVDLDRDRELIELVTRLAQGSGGQPDAAGAVSALRAKLAGENVSVSVRSGQADVNVGGLFFEVGAQGDALAVQARGSCEAVLPGGFSFSTSVRTLGKVGRGLDWSDLTVRVLSFASTVFSTGRQTVQVVWKGNELAVSKIQDRSPIDLGVAVDLDRRRLDVTLRTEEFRPDRLVRLEGRYAGLNRWLSAPVTASGRASYGLDDGRLEYDAEIAALFDEQLPVREVRLSSRLHGTGRQVWFEPLRLESPSGSVGFVGNLLFANLFPEGLLTLTDFNAWQGDKVNASVALQRMSGRLEVKGSRASVGPIGFDRLEASVEPAAEGMRVALEASFDGVRDDALSATGVLSRGALSFTASLDAVPADRLYHLALGAVPLTVAQQDIKAFLGPLSLTAEVGGSTDLRTFSISSPKLSLASAEDPRTRLSAAVQFSSSRLAITGIDGSWQGIALAGDLRGEQDPGGKVSFASAVRIQGTPYEAKGTYSIADGLSVTGSYGLAVAASRGRTGVLALSARATDLPLPVPGGPRAVSFDVQGSFPPQGEWSIASPGILVYDLPFLESRTNRTEVALRLGPRRLQVDRIRFADAFSTLEGTAEADIQGLSGSIDAGVLDRLIVVGRASLAAGGGPESYSAKGELRAGTLGVQYEFAGSPVARLAPAAIKGLLAGRGTVNGPLAAPAVELNVGLREGRLGTDPLALSGQVGLAGSTVTVRNLSAGYVSHRLAGGEGSVDLAKGTFGFRAVYSGEYFLDPVRLLAGLTGTFRPGAGTGGAATLFERDLRGTLALGGITVGAAQLPGWEVRFATEGGALALEGGPANSVRATLNPDMTFSFASAAPLPVVGEAVGRITGDRLAATLDVASADLRVLNAMMKSPIISITSGVAFGRLQVQGPLNDPDFSGSLEVIGGGLLARTYCPDEIGPVSTRFVFDGKTFRGGPVTATAGPGRVSGTAAFTMDHWVPVDFDISFATEPGSTVRVAVKFGSLIADGRASGGARVVGGERRTDVTGSAVVSDCRISLGPYPGGEFVAEDPPTFVAFTVQTGRRVEFLWPSETFPVLRTTASAGGRVDVTYRGDTGGYTVKGSTEVRGGEVFYFDRSFVVKSGAIAFDETEKAFDPRITARAEVREWDSVQNEEVKIYLDADSRLSQFSPRFSSDPSRTDVEILAMIGAPIFARAGEQGLGVQALMLSSDILSQFGLLRPFEQRIRQLLNLDMFSIRTQIVQNLVAQKVFGVELNPLDNTALSLGKYLGNDLFLEMLVRLQSRPGVAGSSNPTGTLASEVELNIEWATPFFLLEWSFLPRTPETLFLADNSLSMKWRYSY